MYAGSDVWFNNPCVQWRRAAPAARRPRSTARLNCSVRDGWWDEMTDGVNGWDIPDERRARPRLRARRCRGCWRLPHPRREIIPLFYDETTQPLADAWVARVKQAWRSLGTAGRGGAHGARQRTRGFYRPSTHLARAALSRSARRTTASGTNFSLFSEVAAARRAVPVRRRRQRDARRPAGGDGVRLARLPPRRPRPALRLPRARAVGPGARACAATRQAAARSRTRKAVEGRCSGTTASFALPLRRSRRVDERRRQRAAHAASRSSSTRTSTGATTAARHAAGTRRSSTRSHVKGFTMRHPDVPEELRGTYAGLAHPAGRSTTSRRSASPPSSCCPSTSSSTTRTCVERGLRNYWGYNSIGYFAPHNAYAASGQRGRAGAGVQADGQGAARRRHRGDPRRRLQPHRRGQPPRARCCRSRASTTPAYYRLVADDPRYYMDYTGTGNSLNMRHPHVLQLIMD